MDLLEPGRRSKHTATGLIHVTVRDSSDVIEGEIGHARLKEPRDDPDTGADLGQLPEIESGPGAGTKREVDARNGSV